MDRGSGGAAVVLDIYEGGKDLIPGWELKHQAEGAMATGGIEGLLRRAVLQVNTSKDSCWRWRIINCGRDRRRIS